MSRCDISHFPPFWCQTLTFYLPKLFSYSSIQSHISKTLFYHYQFGFSKIMAQNSLLYCFTKGFTSKGYYFISIYYYKVLMNKLVLIDVNNDLLMNCDIMNVFYGVHI